MEMSRQVHALAALTHVNSPDVHWIEKCACQMGHIDAVDKRDISCTYRETNNESAILKGVA